LLLFLAPCFLTAEALSVQEYGYSLDLPDGFSASLPGRLPDGWVPSDALDPARLSFTDPASGSMLEISIVGYELPLKAGQMESRLHEELKADGAATSFSFSGRDACFSEVVFSSDGRGFHGFILVVKGLDESPSASPTVDGILIAFAPREKFAKAKDMLLSALDSFSPDSRGKLLPGAISQLADAFPDGDRKPVVIAGFGKTFDVTIGGGERTAAQTVVEREARLLSSYTAGQVPAWRRFYRMIYRDGYHRLDGILTGLKTTLASQGVPSEEVPLKLLSWIQGFSYQRTGTLSDFLSPLSVAVSEAGDCDSRALLYAALLNHLGIDSILFVSTRYSHAIAGVRLTRPGAAMTVQGKRYLVAETTESVALGLIAQDMADPDAWIAMELKE
jgi:hypothetical protein